MDAESFQVLADTYITHYPALEQQTRLEAQRIALALARIWLQGESQRGRCVPPELFALIDNALDIGKVG